MVFNLLILLQFPRVEDRRVIILSSIPSSPFLYVKVSALAYASVCSRSSRIRNESRFTRYGNLDNSPKKIGIEMHDTYSSYYKSFDRRYLRYQLIDRYGNVIERITRNIVVRGKFDDLRVLIKFPSLDKVVSIIEVKTTSRKDLYWYEKEASKFQLQIYIWILKPLIERLGYKLHSRHYVEIYSQSNKRLIERIPVYEEPDMDRIICNIIDSWYGLERSRYPPVDVCKKCPVKEKCPRWIS